MPTTLVKLWCSSLWETFHCSAGVAWSHSQVVEWIFGSRIQSHWPCRMLWPISMLSRILATDRPAVPTSQAGGKIENSSTARLPSSRLRWVLMTLRMYFASLSPRRVDDALPDRVELDAEHLDVLGREVGDRVVGLLLDRGHGALLLQVGCGAVVSGRGGSRRRRR